MSKRSSLIVWMPTTAPMKLDVTGEGTSAVGVFRKDVLRSGKYSHPKAGWTATWTKDDLESFVRTFEAMRANGYDVEVTKDHSAKVDDVIGYVTGMDVIGETLYATMEIRGEQSLDLVQRVRNVSIEVAPSLVDGSGRKYGASIVAVSVVQKPIVTAQGEFVRAASLEAGGIDSDVGILIGAGRTVEETGDNAMDVKKILSLLGTMIGAEVTEANAEAELTKWIDKSRSTTKALSEAQSKAADLQARVDVLSGQIKAAAAQSYSALSEPQREAIDMRAEAIGERLDTLIGKIITIDADVVKLLSQAVLGAPASRNVLMLSKDAEGTVAARTIIEGLAGKAKSALERYSVPSRTEPDAGLDDVAKEMVALATAANPK